MLYRTRKNQQFSHNLFGGESCGVVNGQYA